MSFTKLAESIAKEAAQLLVAEIVALSADLKNSRLVESVTTEIIDKKEYTLVNVLANHYYKFIESGRRAGALPPPYIYILDWVKRKKLTAPGLTTLQLAFAIRNAIAKNGIKPRPYLNSYQNKVNAMIDERRFSELIQTELINNYKKK